MRKKVERIDMRFGRRQIRARGPVWSPALDGDPYPVHHRQVAFLEGHVQAHCKRRGGCEAAMQPFTKLLWTLVTVLLSRHFRYTVVCRLNSLPITTATRPWCQLRLVHSTRTELNSSPRTPVLRSNRTLTARVSLQPISTKCSGDADARDQ